MQLFHFFFSVPKLTESSGKKKEKDRTSEANEEKKRKEKKERTANADPEKRKKKKEKAALVTSMGPTNSVKNIE